MFMRDLQAHVGLASTGHSAYKDQLASFRCVCIPDLTDHGSQCIAGNIIDPLDARQFLFREVELAFAACTSEGGG